MERQQSNSLMYTIIGVISLLIIGYVGFMYFQREKLVKYEDPSGRFTIGYPENWSVSENQHGAAVIFTSPKDNEMDFFQENIGVYLQDNRANPINLRKYSETAIYQMRVVFKENLTVKEEESTRLSDRPGYKFVFTGRGEDANVGNFELAYKMVWTLKDNIGYQISYASLSAHYEKYLKLIDKMIKSFKIL